MNNKEYENIIKTIELFKQGYKSIIDIINLLKVDLVDSDITELEKIVNDYKNNKESRV
jgi:hypothetical protein